LLFQLPVFFAAFRMATDRTQGLRPTDYAAVKKAVQALPVAAQAALVTTAPAGPVVDLRRTAAQP
jgi:hypothetical protein